MFLLVVSELHDSWVPVALELHGRLCRSPPGRPSCPRPVWAGGRQITRLKGLVLMNPVRSLPALTKQAAEVDRGRSPS